MSVTGNERERESLGVQDLESMETHVCLLEKEVRVMVQLM